MPGLHNVAAASTDVLVPGLSLSAPSTASYVLDRTFTTHYPQGSNVYSPDQGQRLIRFVISSATRPFDVQAQFFAGEHRESPHVPTR